MAVTNYYTVNGRIRGEASSGVRKNYLPDALGSVTATVNEFGVVQNTYRYKPYGSLLAKTGVSDDPKFLWVGQMGYRSATSSISYVVSRHVSSVEGMWTSKDSVWPSQMAYVYAYANPTTYIDPSGSVPCQDCTPTTSIRKLGARCIVKPVTVGGTKWYQLQIYKCMKVHCKVVGEGSDCTLTQYADLKTWSNGVLKSDIEGIVDLTFPVSCPGVEYFIDGPGYSEDKPDQYGDCSLQPLKATKADAFLKTLPHIWKAWFTDECKCGTKVSTQKWTFGFELSLNKKTGAVDCKYLRVYIK